MTSADDHRYMAAALRLSRWHTGLTKTNPSVGCILVKDGLIIAKAVTAVGGRPHAERQALEAAGDLAQGASAYVTLEPCSHYGQTPPCANALVAAGVSRVVVSVLDPDPRVAGRGMRILQEAGIAVDVGVLEGEGRRVLSGYLTRQTRQRPCVTLKLAVSADGMLGRRGEEVIITGPAARAQVHAMRAENDAILVGIGTALSDDPELTVRLPGMDDRSPVRIVLDRRLDLPLYSNLVRSARIVPVLAAVVGEGGSAEREQALVAEGVEVLRVPQLADFLSALAARGMSSLFVEGGAAAATAFLQAGLVDRVILCQGQVVVGEGGLESPLTPSDMPKEFRLIREEHFGPDHSYEYERVC